jgi:hypothetical protein
MFPNNKVPDKFHNKEKIGRNLFNAIPQNGNFYAVLATA